MLNIPAHAAQPQPVVLQFFVDEFIYTADGQPLTMDVTPIIRDGRTLLPVRYVADAVGAGVEWDHTARKVTIRTDGRIIELWIGNPIAHINNVPVLTDSTNPAVYPIIHHGRTMIPLRFVAENLGAEVVWDPDARSASVLVTDPLEPPLTVTTSETEMLQLINGERTSRGLPALTLHHGLVKLARMKSKDLIDLNYFAHISPTYGSPFDMMQEAGISYGIAAENIAGASTVDKAHTLLMNSPEHRINILNPAFTHIGIGILTGSQYGAIYTQMFIGP